jgi:hypothetical protein
MAPAMLAVIAGVLVWISAWFIMQRVINLSVFSHCGKKNEKYDAQRHGSVRR